MGAIEAQGEPASPASPGNRSAAAGESPASLGGQFPSQAGALGDPVTHLSQAAMDTLISWEQLDKRSRFPGWRGGRDLEELDLDFFIFIS